MSKNLTLSNSDSSLPTPPASITVSGSTVISIDDYVYLLPEYPEEPYYIGRVMEFVYVPRVRQPKPLLSMTSHQKSAGDQKSSTSSPQPEYTESTGKREDAVSSAQLRVRLAWFQRPRDLPVTRVRAKDIRLLVATMHSDLNPISAIKGKCFVKHTSEIADLNSWKAKPDHYYYAQLFDRYSTRLYDIIPVSNIRNAPQEILQKLHNTYQFIFAEPQKIADLVNTRRACTVCAKWCSINDYIRQREPGDFWEEGGKVKFDECLREYGSNLQSIHNAIPENTRRAITLRYYLERPTERGKQLLEAYDNRNHAGLRRPNLGQGESAVNVHHEIASDAGISSVNTPASSPRSTGMVTRDHTNKYSNDASDRPSLRCLNCQRERASRWHPAPLELTVYNTRGSKGSAARRLICGDCREYWMHYAMMPDQEAINARKHQNIPSSAAGGTTGSQQNKGDDSRRASSRAKNAPAVTLQRPRLSESWSYTPCDVCKQETHASDHQSLMCHDCGVCVHVGCAGYPESARVDDKRWKCGVCTNITNPTISINYMCILCRKDASPAGRPRQVLWRTSGNNWVHPLCALAVHETSLLFVNNSIVVNGIPTIPQETWLHKCSTCVGAGGVAIQCAVKGCDEGAHVSCTQNAQPSSDPAAPGRAVLVARSPDSSINVETIVQDIAAFVASGGRLVVALKCAQHIDADRQLDIDLTIVDPLGASAVSAVAAAKMISTPHARGAMLHASLIKPQNSKLPAVSTSTSNGSEAKSNGKSAQDGMKSRMVSWNSLAEDPVCVRCTTDFSPIWWPMSPASTGVSANMPTERVKVLCQRCYTTGSTHTQHSNVAT
ncbi:putative PHD type zinc finger protein with BAH domain-containing protein [Dipsacomyces acuminosporus]|nr:putative PHD type zinc finger protein with BAH domain-containing protein [Dipsacomyces acuminosporus]